MNLTVFHLITILFLAQGGYTESRTTEYPSSEECKRAEEAVHKAAELSNDVVDVGTLCIRSEFDSKVKPRA